MRDLTKTEREFYRILVKQYEDDRPARLMCGLVDRFIKLYWAYEKKCKETKKQHDQNELLNNSFYDEDK
jgi:hypothetical protein